MNCNSQADVIGFNSLSFVNSSAALYRNVPARQLFSCVIVSLA